MDGRLLTGMGRCPWTIAQPKKEKKERKYRHLTKKNEKKKERTHSYITKKNEKERKNSQYYIIMDPAVVA